MMTEYTFGDKQARNVLVQMVDSHDLSVMENEVASIRQMTGAKFYLIAMKVNGPLLRFSETNPLEMVQRTPWRPS